MVIYGPYNSSDWRKSKSRPKTVRNGTKTTFFSFIFSIPLSYTSRQFQHCSMRQSKVRAKNVQHRRDLVVTPP